MIERVDLVALEVGLAEAGPEGRHVDDPVGHRVYPGREASGVETAWFGRGFETLEVKIGGDLALPVVEELADDQVAAAGRHLEKAVVRRAIGGRSSSEEHLELAVGLGRQVVAVEVEELLDVGLGEIGGHGRHAQVADRPD